MGDRPSVDFDKLAAFDRGQSPASYPNPLPAIADPRSPSNVVVEIDVDDHASLSSMFESSKRRASSVQRRSPPTKLGNDPLAHESALGKFENVKMENRRHSLFTGESGISGTSQRSWGWIIGIDNDVDMNSFANLLVVLLAVASLVASIFPFVFVATGRIVRTPIIFFIIGALGVLAYALVLLLTLLNEKFFNSHFRWIIDDSERGKRYFGDRFFSFMNGVFGLFANLIVFVGWLDFFLRTRGMDTRKEFVESYKEYKTEGYASFAALSAGLYFFVFGFFLATLLYSIGSRKNRDLINFLSLRTTKKDAVTLLEEN